MKQSMGPEVQHYQVEYCTMYMCCIMSGIKNAFEYLGVRGLIEAKFKICNL